MNLPQFLEMKFLDWQQKLGKRQTIKDFADYLGVSQASISYWMNGERKPEGDSIKKLASKLGLEVYDSLGLDRPDADLDYIERHWGEISPEKRKEIRDKAERFVAENESRITRKPKRANTSAN